MINRLIAVAPMLDWTDRHYRYFLRLITRQALLYTEMTTTGAILKGRRFDLLRYSACEHPLALQLGGAEPAALAQCAKIAEDYGYDEINLNVGCPSDRVHAGRFGACLMAEPNLVAQCVAAMRDVVHLPITVKTRIGIDQRDSYTELTQFIQTVASAGCDIFIIHARKAWLNGLSPKENREIPPLRYDIVYQLKRDFPHLRFIINGGITNLKQIQQHLTALDGVMIGRAICHNPYAFAAVDQIIYGADYPMVQRQEILQQFIAYACVQLEMSVPLSQLIRPLLTLYHERPGARAWRRFLSERAYRKGAGIEILTEAAALMRG